MQSGSDQTKIKIESIFQYHNSTIALTLSILAQKNIVFLEHCKPISKLVRVTL